MQIGKIIIVEGLQGSGKTLFCKSQCQWNSNCVVLEEWVDPEFLAKYIANMETMATEFQFKAQEETIKRLERARTLALQGKTVFLDRGIRGDQAFAEVQYDAGYINTTNMKQYRNRASAEMSTPLGVLVPIETWLLLCPIETCLSRIKHRNRDGESAYQYEYLLKLHEKHQELLKPDRIINVVENHKLTEGGFLPRDVCIAVEV